VVEHQLDRIVGEYVRESATFGFAGLKLQPGKRQLVKTDKENVEVCH
jgi:hypothetical protein